MDVSVIIVIHHRHSSSPHNERPDVPDGAGVAKMVQLTRMSRRVRRFLGSRSDGRRRPGWCGRMRSAVGGPRAEHHSRPHAAGNFRSRTTSDCGTDRGGWWMRSTKNANCASVAVSLPCWVHKHVSSTRCNILTTF